MTEPAAPTELRRLTSLRWYAALLVFAYHVNAFVPWRPLRVFTFGQAGVTFFFVLSGFVLTWSLRPGRARDFYLRRFARIYPAMFVVLVATALLILAWPAAPFFRGPLGLGTNVLVVQAWWPGNYPVYAYNGVAWSLAAEAFFYALFPWVARWLIRLPARRQVAAAVVGLIVAVGVSALLAGGGHGDDVAYSNPAIRFPEFLLGMVLAVRIRAGWRPRVRLWAAVLFVIVGAAIAREVPTFAFQDYVMLLPFAALIVAAAARDVSGGAGGILTHPWAVYLGRLSFSFYLVHQVVIKAVVVRWGWGRPWSLFAGVAPVAVCFVLAIVAAAALHHGVEVPVERRIRGRIRRPVSAAA